MGCFAASHAGERDGDFVVSLDPVHLLLYCGGGVDCVKKWLRSREDWRIDMEKSP